MKLRKIVACLLSLSLILSIPVISLADGTDWSSDSSGSEKTKQEIKGTFVYHVNWSGKPSNVILRTSAMSRITYEIMEGSEVATLEGATLTVKKQGEIKIKATAEETVLYEKATAVLVVTCDNSLFMNTIGTETKEYAGMPVPYTYQLSNGVKTCVESYSSAIGIEDFSWSLTAPVEMGTYTVKLDITDLNDNEFVRYTTLIIKKRVLTIDGLGVKTRTYNGKTDATITGQLKGALDSSVQLVLPKASFKSAAVGKNKKVTVSGKPLLTGNTDKYELKSYDLSNLRGTITKATVTIIATDLTSVQYQPLKELKYSVNGSYSDLVKFTKKPKLKCKVTNRSAAGLYTIKVYGAKARNFKFEYVNGSYCMVAGYEEKSPEPIIIPEPVRTPEPEITPEPSVEVIDPDASKEPEVFRKYTAGGAIQFEGITSERVYTDSNYDVVIDRVVTNTSVVKSENSEFEFSIGKSGWTTNINIMSQLEEDVQQVALDDTGIGECTAIPELVIKIRDRKNPKLKGKMLVHQFIVDTEVPSISIDGLELIEGEITGSGKDSSEPISISIQANYGITGQQYLLYKLIGSSDVMVDSGWKRVQGSIVTIDHDFNGCIAIKAQDKLGNNRIVQTESVSVDVDAPTVEGIDYNQTYPEVVKYRVSDASGVKSVTIDGEAVKDEGSYNRSGTHTMVVEDNRGHKQAITFKISTNNWIRRIMDSIKSTF